MKDKVEYLELSRIRPNPYQPRASFEKVSLENLASSLKKIGLMQPIMVRPHKGGYQIVLGERRWRAAQMAGLDELLAVVREMDDKTLQLYSISENIHRKDLESEEREKAIHDLWTKHFEPAGMSMHGMDRELGMEEGYTSGHTLAYGRRTKLRLGGAEVSTEDLKQTGTLDVKTAGAMLKAKAKGEISAKDFARMAPVVKDAPEAKRKAIVEEVIKTSKQTEQFKQLVQKEAEAYAKGEIEGRVKVTKAGDFKRLDRFGDIWNEVRFWTVATIEMIESPAVRKKAVKVIEQTRDHCEKLLQKVQERDWYGGKAS